MSRWRRDILDFAERWFGGWLENMRIGLFRFAKTIRCRVKNKQVVIDLSFFLGGGLTVLQEVPLFKMYPR